MIKIENKKTYKGDGWYVGRPSPLGNPFHVGGKISRYEAISMYRMWLLERLETDNPTSKAFMALVDDYQKNGKMTLICHCFPLACHAEVIREFIEVILEFYEIVSPINPICVSQTDSCNVKT